MKKTPSVKTVDKRSKDYIDDIQDIVSAISNVPMDLLISSSRGRQRITDARMLSMFFCHAYELGTLTEIARRHGKADHCTVIHARKQVQRMKAVDIMFSRIYTRC